MRDKSLLSIALVAFAFTSLAKSAAVTRGMPSEDLHAAIVSADADFDKISERGQADFVSLATSAVERDVETRANDAGSLLALLPPGQKRADSAAQLLALLPAGHDKRSDAASLLALLPAGHGSEKREPSQKEIKRAENAAALLASLPAGHSSAKRADAASLLALLPAGHGSG